MREIFYPPKGNSTEPLKVELLDRDEAVELTADFLRLIIRAYGHQFEGQSKPLPSGTFQKRFSTRKALKKFQKKNIPSVYERGGEYAVIRNPHGDRRVSSVLKTLPGDKLNPRFAGMSWIAEILTDPDDQYQGQGSALLHAHLTHTAAPNSRLVLEAFDGSPVNNWYEHLGFEHKEPTDPLVLRRGLVLPEHYMVTPEHIVASSIQRQLSEQLGLV